MKQTPQAPAIRWIQCQIDFTQHALEDFPLKEGQVLHLLHGDGEKLVFTIEDLFVDEAPWLLGGTAGWGQVAESTDGHWILCMEGCRYVEIVVEVHDSVNSIPQSLLDWDGCGPIAPADAFIMLMLLDAFELKPEFREQWRLR